ncbi:MAG: DUF4091 domain-containing protein [Candidatus Aminicenantes bacterium]|nr:MAG: DUF4091 domain-containing protein [Candidatus Aminicenantes bacterium]
MRKSILIGCLSFLTLATMAACSKNRPLSDCETYAEAVDPAPDKTADWEAVGPGLHASIGSIDQHYFKTSVPQITENHRWNGTAWRGEKVSAQLVLWSRDPVEKVECTFSEFIGENEKILSAQIAQVRFVRYVITDEFADGCGKRNPEDYAAFLYPDALDNVTCYNMKGKTTQPVWITMQVSREAEPGIYKSTMHLLALGRKIQSFQFELEVLPLLLPPPAQWKFHLDLWQNPYAVSRIHKVKPWSEAHWEVLKPVMKMLADAGQKVITTSINKKPWAGQTFDPFDSMIVWTKKVEGSWAYDYTVFDNWVQFMMDLGVKKQINCYSMIPWSSELVYFEEDSGKEVTTKIEPGSEEYIALWTPFLIDFRLHLEEKGWNRITNIAVDERGGEKMQLVLKLLEDQAPELGVALADNEKTYKIYPDQIKDLCVSYIANIDEEDLMYRKSKGYASTYYVCCKDPFPNTFTFSPPVEATFISWYAMAAGFDGFLRWSYCSWVKDPLRDSRFRTWPAGDTYIVYPDARSSIRFERLIEGIQDAEKIRILREAFEKAGTEEAKQKLELLNKTVAQFNLLSKPENTEALINHGKKILADLSR